MGSAPLDDGPWSVARAGSPDQLFGRLHEVVVAAPVRPVLLRHAPRLIRIRLQSLEARLLLISPQVHPELHDDGPVVGPHALHHEDVVELPVEVRRGRTPFHPVHERLVVPGRQVQTDLASGRQVAPEAPLRGHLALDFGRRAVGVGSDAPRIHPAVQKVGRLPLPRAVHARKYDQERRVGSGKLELGLEQQPSQVGLSRLKKLVGDLLAEFGGFEHGWVVEVRGRTDSGAGGSHALDRRCRGQPAVLVGVRQGVGQRSRKNGEGPPRRIGAALRYSGGDRSHHPGVTAQTTETFSAAGPFWPSTMSNSTVAPSASVLKPVP